MSAPARPTVFISYSHKDAEFVHELRNFLEPLQHEFGDIELWIDNTDIRVGDVWADEIDRALSSAAVAVVLYSYNFRNSTFIRDTELPRLLGAAKTGQMALVPLIVDAHETWGSHALERYQAVNLQRPLATLESERPRQPFYHQVAQRVREHLQARRQAAAAGAPAAATAAAAGAASAAAPRGAPPVAPAAASPVSAARPAAAVPAIRGLEQAAAVLLSPEGEGAALQVLAVHAAGLPCPLLQVDCDAEAVTLAVMPAEALHEVPLAPEARRALDEELGGSVRALGAPGPQTAALVAARVQQLAARLGLPSASVGLVAELVAVQAGDDDPAGADLADPSGLEASGDADTDADADGELDAAAGPQADHDAAGDDAAGGAAAEVDQLLHCVRELLSRRRSGAWTLTVAAGDALPLLWVDRDPDGVVGCVLPENADLPRALAIGADRRRFLREEASFVHDDGQDARLFGHVSELDAQGLAGELQAVLDVAYALGERGIQAFATLAPAE